MAKVPLLSSLLPLSKPEAVTGLSWLLWRCPSSQNRGISRQIFGCVPRRHHHCRQRQHTGTALQRCCPHEWASRDLSLCFCTTTTETLDEPPAMMVTIYKAARYHCTETKQPFVWASKIESAPTSELENVPLSWGKNRTGVKGREVCEEREDFCWEVITWAHCQQVREMLWCLQHIQRWSSDHLKC